MWVKANPNPAGLERSDCVVRAICIATNRPWLRVFDELCSVARQDYGMPSENSVWGHYLYMLGFVPFMLKRSCPQCTTVSEFTRWYPKGIYIIGTGTHAVAVVDGDYYDSWDSGDQIPSYFWKIA